eukprot:scaffold174671_cov40-Tisochrysis_lutea.AAC.1
MIARERESESERAREDSAHLHFRPRRSQSHSMEQEPQNARQIVLAAVRQCGWALEDASEALRNDPVIVLEAVRQNAG